MHAYEGAGQLCILCIYTCKGCPQTFISSKVLRNHECDSIPNIKNSAEDEKNVKDSVWVFASVGTIESESEKYFDRCAIKESESTHLNETQKNVESKDLAQTAIAKDLAKNTDSTKLADNENKALEIKDEKVKLNAVLCLES